MPWYTCPRSSVEHSLFAASIAAAAAGGWLAVSASEAVPPSGRTEPDSTRVAVFSRADLEAERASLERPYLPFLTTATLRAGLYELGAGADDGQQPHDKYELYYVLAGGATLFADGERNKVNEAGLRMTQGRL